MVDQYDEHSEQRETLNAHRRHGPGWGQRKPRRDGKPHTRRLSKREEERADDVVRTVVKLCALPLTDMERSETAAMLGRDFQLHGADKLGPSTLWNAVKVSPNRHLVINANKKYLKAIIYVYGLYETVVSADDLSLALHVKRISELTKIPLTPNFSLLRAILRFAIDYEEDNEKSDQHGKWSRDALAIQWLISQGMKSNQVEAYQKKHGGGVDKWSKRMSKPAAVSMKKQEVELVASRMEKELREKDKLDVEKTWIRKIEEEEANEKNGDGITRWSKVAPIVETKEQHRLQKLVGGGVWLNQMLLYYSREKGIAPSEGMITFVVGDPSSPSGVRHVSTMSIGHVVAGIATLADGFKWLCKLARRLFGPKNPYTMSEAAWRHGRDENRAKSQDQHQ